MKRMVRPWFLRLVHDSRFSHAYTAIFAGAVWALIVGAAWALVSALDSQPTELTSEFLRYWIRTSVVVGYIFWASHYAVYGVDQNIEHLPPDLVDMEQISEADLDALHYPRFMLIGAGVMGVLFCVLAAQLSYQGFTHLIQGQMDTAEGAMLLTRVLLFFLVGQVLYVIFALISRMRRFGKRNLKIHLFALQRLRPFARMGLPLALILTVAAAIPAALSISWSGPGAELSFNIFIVVPVQAAAIVAAAIPFLAIRQRIVQEKQTELDRLESALYGKPDALLNSPMADRLKELDLTALIAYKKQVEDVPNWPFLASTSKSLGFYVLIPVMGWIGGALVERLLGRVF